VSKNKIETPKAGIIKTQKEAAAFAGVTERTIRRWVAGDPKMSRDPMPKTAAGYFEKDLLIWKHLNGIVHRIEPVRDVLKANINKLAPRLAAAQSPAEWRELLESAIDGIINTLTEIWQQGGYDCLGCKKFHGPYHIKPKTGFPARTCKIGEQNCILTAKDAPEA